MSQSFEWEHHALYAPPWSDRLPDGRLGPAYGPTPAEWGDAWSAWAVRPFWDSSEDAPRRVMGDTPQGRMPRQDHTLLETWMESHSHQVPERELEVYYLAYRDGLSRDRIARRLEISTCTVVEYLRRLRKRAAKNPVPVAAELQQPIRRQDAEQDIASERAAFMGL